MACIYIGCSFCPQGLLSHGALSMGLFTWGGILPMGLLSVLLTISDQFEDRFIHSIGFDPELTGQQ